MSSWVPDTMPAAMRISVQGEPIGGPSKAKLVSAVALVAWALSVIIGLALLLKYNNTPHAATYVFDMGGAIMDDETIPDFWKQVECVRSAGGLCTWDDMLPCTETEHGCEISPDVLPTCTFFILPGFHVGEGKTTKGIADADLSQEANTASMDAYENDNSVEGYWSPLFKSCGNYGEQRCEGDELIRFTHSDASANNLPADVLIAKCIEFSGWDEAFALASPWQQGLISAFFFIAAHVINSMAEDQHKGEVLFDAKGNTVSLDVGEELNSE